ncbi:hypothetical protein [Novosphingobium sp. 17-62-19]|uniref:hypothetical protein n=1 Tax=Novosphingobium sp. 17-62-19 TaxID=1970406 RepID=UPI00344FF63B
MLRYPAKHCPAKYLPGLRLHGASASNQIPFSHESNARFNASDQATKAFPALPAGSIRYWYDQLVGMGDIEIAAKQFTNKIRVGMARIEQCDTVFDPIPLGRKTGDFLLTLLKQARIFTPGQQTARPSNTGSTEQKQRNQRHRLRKAVFWKQRRPAGVHDFC